MRNLILHRLTIACVCACAVAIAVSCATSDPAPPGETSGGATSVEQPPRELPGVHNLIRFDDGVYSGSMPHGDAGFDSLAGLGVKTVVSVDGARPDLERAHARVMRYVHVPIQYSGIEPDARLALARALRDMPGPIYVHCHHGKHRGPAAASYALIAIGRIVPARGVELMREAGTSEQYAGLYRCVGCAAPVADHIITELGGDLPEHARVTGMVASMAEIDRAWDHLKILRDNGWSAPADHPDLHAPSEAGVVYDALRTLPEDPEARAYPRDFHSWLDDAIGAAAALEGALAKDDARAAFTAMEALARSCTDCHARYRNN